MSILQLNENEQRINSITDIMFFLEDKDGEQKAALESELNQLISKESFSLEWMLNTIKEKQITLNSRVEVRKNAQKREQSAKNALEFMRQRALDKMYLMGVEKFDGDHGSMTISNGQKQVVYSDSFDLMNISKNFIRTKPAEYFPEKEKIKKYLKEGYAITGCTLVDGEKILTVR